MTLRLNPPGNFAKIAATRSVDEICRHYRMGLPAARRFLADMPQEWRDAREEVMAQKRRTARVWVAPQEFAERCLALSVDALSKHYRVDDTSIRKALKALPQAVLDERERLRRQRISTQMRQFSAMATEQRQADATDKTDRFAARFAEVAARNGWRVWEVAA
jgi:hypothetical protein